MPYPGEYRLVRPAVAAESRAPVAPETRLKMEITPSGSCLPVMESLAEVRAKKADVTRATLRPEIAGLPIATENPDLAALLQKIVDAYNASSTVPAYSPLDLFNVALERQGLIQPVWGANSIVGYRPTPVVLNAKPPALAQKTDTGGAWRPGSLMGLRNP